MSSQADGHGCMCLGESQEVKIPRNLPSMFLSQRQMDIRNQDGCLLQNEGFF